MPPQLVDADQTTVRDSELLSLSPSGTPPRTRISSAQQVRDMYGRARRHNALRSQRNALVKGLVDGNPPYNQAAINRAGQMYRPNFNNGEAESYLNIALSAFYDLFSEVETFATVEIDDYNDPLSHDLSQRLTCHFDWLQRQDPDMDYNIQLSHHDMVLYGAGPHLFEDSLDWRSRPVRFEDMLLPRYSESNVTRWEWVDLSYNYTVSQLYEFISDEEAARAAGWNISAVKRSIILAGQSMGTSDPFGRDWQKWETWQQSLRNNDLWLGDRCRQVRVIRTLWCEFARNGEPGRVSEAWVDENDTGHDDFLLKRTGIYETMKQAVCPFFFDRGDGTAHSVRGLGVKMFKLLMAKMRLQNDMVGAASARGAIMVQASGGGAGQQQMAMTHLGPYSILPAGFQFVANTAVPGVLDSFIVAARDLDNTLVANLSQYRQRVESPQSRQGNPRTAYEVSTDMQQAASLAKTQIARYYEQLDDWYSERFRRASNPDIPRTTRNPSLKLALEFQERCKRDNINLASLKKKVCVKATRAVGQGSAFVRVQTLNMILNTVWPTLPESGKQAVVRDLIAASVGKNYVGRYAGYSGQTTAKEQNDRWAAQQENNDFAQGGFSLVTEHQNDFWHLDEHFAFANSVAQSLEQGADPAKAWLTLDTAGKHIAQHLERLGQDPKRKAQIDFFNQQFMQLSQVTDQLGQAVQKMQEEEAAQQQAAANMDAEIALKARKVEADIELKRDKQDATIARQKEQQDVATALDDARTAAAIQREAAVAQAKMQQMKNKPKKQA